MSGQRNTKAKGPWVGLNPATPPPDMDIKVEVSATDTTTDYLDAKVAVAGNLSKSILLPGGNEVLQISDSDTPKFSTVYLADPATDGTWRITQSGNDLVFERRESGTYIQKGAITP